LTNLRRAWDAEDRPVVHVERRVLAGVLERGDGDGVDRRPEVVGAGDEIGVRKNNSKTFTNYPYIMAVL
jgi:hypothetical protein